MFKGFKVFGQWVYFIALVVTLDFCNAYFCDQFAINKTLEVEVISYNEITGVLSRLKIAPNAPVGPCGLSRNSSGYLQVRYNGIKYAQHRIIWKIMTGHWPRGQVDHINGVRTDNRWENLREVSGGENSKNRRNQVNNKSGIPGISWCKRSDRWLARISVEGARVHLGYFDTLLQAATARWNAEREYGYHENHGRSKMITCTTKEILKKSAEKHKEALERLAKR